MTSTSSSSRPSSTTESGAASATLDHGEGGHSIQSTTGAGEGGEETSGDARAEETVNDTVEYLLDYEEYWSISDMFYDCSRCSSALKASASMRKQSESFTVLIETG